MKETTDDDQENRIDTMLMLRIRGGDEEAMKELILRHQNSVYGTIAGMLRNSPDVEDIAQQVFIRIWKAAPTYEPTAKFKTWMFTILRNQVFNEMRRTKRKPAFSSDAAEEESGLIFSVDESHTPDQAVQYDELQKAVDDAIESLPEKARMAVQLRRFENMAYEDIADILGITVSATKSLLFRARTLLKESLDKYLGE